MFFFFQAEDGIRDYKVTGVQTCALPICQDLPLAPAGGGARVCTAARPVDLPPGSRKIETIVSSLAVPKTIHEHRRQWQAGGRPGARHLRAPRSEERRVGKEGRSRWSPYH